MAVWFKAEETLASPFCGHHCLGDIAEKKLAIKIIVRLQEGPAGAAQDLTKRDGDREMVGEAAWSRFPLLPIPIRGLRLWAALIPFLLSVLEKIKIYNPLPHPISLGGTDCIRRRNGN